MKIKNLMVRGHEKMVTASYPQLIKRGVAINIAGALTCYLTGLGLYFFHQKVIAPKIDRMNDPNEKI